MEFEIYVDHRPKLVATARSGAGIQLVPFAVSVSGPISPYEHVYNVAPESGYVSSLDVPVHSSPGPTVYVRAKNGALYARMELDASHRADDNGVKISANIALNPSGSRSLEGFRRSARPKVTEAGIRTSAF
jgi:hypothetical protein